MIESKEYCIFIPKYKLLLQWANFTVLNKTGAQKTITIYNLKSSVSKLFALYVFL